MTLISLDYFYRGLSPEEHDDAANYNFDHPNALDLDLAYIKISELLAGQTVQIPTYDFASHSRTDVMITVHPAPIIIFEGLFAIFEERFRMLMDLKIFVLTPDDIRLSRRIGRDIAERGRAVVEVLAQYCRFVKPAYDDFIKPTMKYSDIIIPFSTSNSVAVDMLCQNLAIKMQIHRSSVQVSARQRSTSEYLAAASRALEQVQKIEEEQEKVRASAFTDTLTFELVDISVDYGEFNATLRVFEAGSKQNRKISALFHQTLGLLEQCSEATDDATTGQLNSSYIFLLCVKRLFKKLLKLIQMHSDFEGCPIIFLPEVISDQAVLTLLQKLDHSKCRKRIVTLACCPKKWQEVIQSGKLGQSQLFCLIFNDEVLNSLSLIQSLSNTNLEFCEWLWTKITTKKGFRND